MLTLSHRSQHSHIFIPSHHKIFTCEIFQRIASIHNLYNLLASHSSVRYKLAPSPISLVRLIVCRSCVGKQVAHIRYDLLLEVQLMSPDSVFNLQIDKQHLQLYVIFLPTLTHIMYFVFLIAYIKTFSTKQNSSNETKEDTHQWLISNFKEKPLVLFLCLFWDDFRL